MDPYRLAPLRGVRDRAERTVRGELAAAVDDARSTADGVAGAAARVAAARAAIAAAVAARDALVAAAGGGAVSPARLALADRYTARRRRDLEAAIGEHLRAAAAHAGRLATVDDARGRLAVARADRELIERHFARWRDQRRKLAERRED